MKTFKGSIQIEYFELEGIEITNPEKHLPESLLESLTEVE